MGDVTHYAGDQCPGGHYEEANVSEQMTISERFRRARRAFRDYPGKRGVDGGEPGVLVRCGEPYGCGGSGVLHQPDRLPEMVTPTDWETTTEETNDGQHRNR